MGELIFYVPYRKIRFQSEILSKYTIKEQKLYSIRHTTVPPSIFIISMTSLCQAYHAHKSLPNPPATEIQELPDRGMEEIRLGEVERIYARIQMF